MTPLFFPVRGRCTATRDVAATGPAPAAQAQETAAVQHAAFDEQQAEHAELLRELDALEALMLAQLKNEDEIMKKWIALIS